MTVFNIKSLLDWSPMAPGDIISFETYGTSRNIAFTVNVTDRVSVYASINEDMSDAVLVGASDGMFDCGFAISAQVYVRFDADPATAIYLRSPAASHVVAKSDEESFTTPTPMGRRNSELDRVMQLVRINEERRNAQLDGEIKALRAERLAAQREQARKEREAAQVIEPTTQETSTNETTSQPAADGS